jgi:maltose O-acetyltransferase
MKAGYWMDHIFIRPEYIKQGIGSKLIDHLKLFCKDNEIHNLAIFVDPNAKGFYKKTGATFKYVSKSNIENRQIPVFEFDFSEQKY